MKKVGIAMIIVAIILILMGIIISIDIPERINKERCFNLPLNEFFEDKSCEKYWNAE